MSGYVTIFDPIPWKLVGLTAIHTFVVYWVVLLGLKAVGRRVFGELGPHDLILLLLISESTDLGIVHQDAGFWGTLTAVLVLLSIVGIMERIPPFRRAMENNPIILKENGQLLENVISKNLVECDDLNRVAHEYGMRDHQAFEKMILEGDGKITGILKPDVRHAIARDDSSKSS